LEILPAKRSLAISCIKLIDFLLFTSRTFIVILLIRLNMWVIVDSVKKRQRCRPPPPLMTWQLESSQSKETQ
jgi:hypothetical protein